MYSRRFILSTLALSALAAQVRPAFAATPNRIRVGWVVMPSDLFPLLPNVAQLTKHLGKSYTIEPQHFAGSTEIITSLASGALDVAALAFSSLPFAIENARLRDLRVIAGGVQDGVDGYWTNPFLVLKDGPIHRVEDLKGKVLATNAEGSASDMAVRVMLRKHGLNDRTDVNIIEAPFPTMKALLKEGKVALVPTVPPFAFDPKLTAISRTLFTQKQAMGRTQMVIHVAREGYFEKNRAPMTDMLEDVLRVLHYFEDPANHTRTVQMIAKVMKQPVARYQSWLFTKEDYYRSPNGVPDLKALQANIETQKELGLLKAAIDVKKYTDLSMTEAAAKRLGYRI